MHYGPTTTPCFFRSSFHTAFGVYFSEGKFYVIAHFSLIKLIKPLTSSWNRDQSPAPCCITLLTLHTHQLPFSLFLSPPCSLPLWGHYTCNTSFEYNIPPNSHPHCLTSAPLLPLLTPTHFSALN